MHWPFRPRAGELGGFTHEGEERPRWPSRSNEQIFYGKTGSPLATYEYQMPYHVKKQGDL